MAEQYQWRLLGASQPQWQSPSDIPVQTLVQSVLDKKDGVAWAKHHAFEKLRLLNSRVLRSSIKINTQYSAMDIYQLKMNKNGHSVLLWCASVPQQKKSEFCSVPRYQYLILHVITTSVLSQVQQSGNLWCNILVKTYPPTLSTSSSFMNTGRSPKLLFSIKHRQEKGLIDWGLKTNVVTIQIITGNYIIRSFS